MPRRDTGNLFSQQVSSFGHQGILKCTGICIQCARGDSQITSRFPPDGNRIKYFPQDDFRFPWFEHRSVLHRSKPKPNQYPGKVFGRAPFFAQRVQSKHDPIGRVRSPESLQKVQTRDAVPVATAKQRDQWQMSRLVSTIPLRMKTSRLSRVHPHTKGLRGAAAPANQCVPASSQTLTRSPDSPGDTSFIQA